MRCGRSLGHKTIYIYIFWEMKALAYFYSFFPSGKSCKFPFTRERLLLCLSNQLTVNQTNEAPVNRAILGISRNLLGNNVRKQALRIGLSSIPYTHNKASFVLTIVLMHVCVCRRTPWPAFRKILFYNLGFVCSVGIRYCCALLSSKIFFEKHGLLYAKRIWFWFVSFLLRVHARDLRFRSTAACVYNWNAYKLPDSSFFHPIVKAPPTDFLRYLIFRRTRTKSVWN